MFIVQNISNCFYLKILMFYKSSIQTTVNVIFLLTMVSTMPIFMQHTFSQSALDNAA